MTLKLHFVCIIFFLSFNTETSHAQDKEEKALNTAFNLFSAYQNGKVDSLPRNAASYYKIVEHLDRAFKSFILHEHSQDYEKFKMAKDHNNFKLFRLENGIEIDAVSFLVDSVSYIVFSYVLQDRRNFFIKRLPGNTIVFDGNGNTAYINNMYSLGNNRLLLIEEGGDGSTSRKASVIATEGKEWKQLKAFKGKAFGQIAADYTNKEFVEKRTYFQLLCDRDVFMTAAQDVNQVSFNEQSKTLSYKQYSSNRQFKKIEAKYENGMFIIDDYNVAERISSDSPAVPH